MLPFWSLNDKLEDAELEEQIERMHDVGIHGFFLHARGGLQTKYMSDEWFDRMETAIKKADELGMEPWLYDENGWPSGAGNDAVPAHSEAFQQKQMWVKTLAEGEALPEHLLGLYEVADGRVTRLSAPCAGAVAIYYVPNPHYIDIMCREATEYFISVTHERYYERLKPYFDGRIRGFFTDEPQYDSATGHLPWSDTLCALWQERYGEDMREKLALLYYDAEGSALYRYRFFTLANELVVHHFVKPLHDWCAAHNCRLTGHMMYEDSLLTQTRSIGAAMPCYEYFQFPGIDHLCREVHNPLVPKQLSSAAAQLGRPTITETFAGCGWDVSLNELKWIAQWQFVNGVTDICQHLQGYTLRGLRKRDWPASLFIQQPWFGEPYAAFNRYFTALGAHLREGREAAELLLIHPIRSEYMVYTPQDYSAGAAFDRTFLNTVQALNDAHIFYHLGDEELLRGHGDVTADGLKMGQCTYRAVALPEICTLSESTFDLLLRFAKAGGRIYALGALPTCIDGAPDDRIKELTALVIPADMAALKAATASLSLTADGAECAAIHATERVLEDGRRYVYLTNLSKDCHETVVTLHGHRRVWVWDLTDDSRTPLAARFDGADTVVSLAFDMYGDYLLVTEPCDLPAAAADTAAAVSLPLGTEAALAVTDNAFTLDFAEWRVDGGEWQPATYVLEIQNKLVLLGHPCNVELRYTFRVASLDGVSTVKMAVERPDRYTFTVNGQACDFNDCGYFVDKSFRLTDIRPLLREGTNEIMMAGHFTQEEELYQLFGQPNVHESVWNRLVMDCEIESIYIVGQFALQAADTPRFGERRTVFGGREFALAPLPEKADVRDLTEQGLWFFAGTATLTQTVTLTPQAGTRYAVRLAALHAPAAKVRVNGQAAGFLSFSPFVCDVTGLLHEGDNTVEIILYSGCRNLLGPHHLKCGEFYCASPDTFTTHDNRNIGWTDDYSFVTFGFDI